MATRTTALHPSHRQTVRRAGLGAGSALAKLAQAERDKPVAENIAVTRSEELIDRLRERAPEWLSTLDEADTDDLAAMMSALGRVTACLDRLAQRAAARRYLNHIQTDRPMIQTPQESAPTEVTQMIRGLRAELSKHYRHDEA